MTVQQFEVGGITVTVCSFTSVRMRIVRPGVTIVVDLHHRRSWWERLRSACDQPGVTPQIDREWYVDWASDGLALTSDKLSLVAPVEVWSTICDHVIGAMKGS